METQIAKVYLFCQPAGLLHDTTPNPPSKSSRVGSSGEPRLWYIGLQERQEYVCVSLSGRELAESAMAVEGMETGYTGRVPVRGCGSGGGLRWSESGEPFYGTDVVTRSLREGTRSRMIIEVGVGGHGVWYPWRWLVNLEFLGVQVLDEIYAGRNGRVERISRLD